MTETATIATTLNRYEVVIGLEVHAQLLTRSKMFCPCPADYINAAPNENTATALYGGSVTYKEWLLPQPNI